MTKHHISYYDKEYPTMEIDLSNGRRVSFSVRDVDPEAREWLGQVLVAYFHDEIVYAERKAREAVRREIRSALGINEGMNKLGF